MEQVKLEINEQLNVDSEIDLSVYMGSCNNAQNMFWMIPDIEGDTRE